MNPAKRAGCLAGSLGAALGTLAYLPAAAPFTAAIMLVPVVLALAAAALTMGAWRTGLVALYSAGATVAVSPVMPWAAALSSVSAGLVLPGIGALLAMLLLAQHSLGPCRE